MARNYRKEYDNYQGTAKQKKARARRNAVRRLFERLGKEESSTYKNAEQQLEELLQQQSLLNRTE